MKAVKCEDCIFFEWVNWSKVPYDWKWPGQYGRFGRCKKKHKIRYYLRENGGYMRRCSDKQVQK